MPRLIGMALRWALLPFLVILASSMAGEFWHALRHRGLGLSSLWHPLVLSLMGGFGSRILIQTLMNRFRKHDPLDFIDTLEHELTHALVGFITFCPPVSLSATLKSGGEVQLKGSNLLAALAPYFLPLWCGIALLLGMVIQSGMQTTWSRIVFFLLGSFLYRLSREYRWRQTDLHVYGFFFSTLSVLIGLLLTLGFILKVQGLISWHWVFASVQDFWHSLPRAWHQLQTWTSRPI